MFVGSIMLLVVACSSDDPVEVLAPVETITSVPSRTASPAAPTALTIAPTPTPTPVEVSATAQNSEPADITETATDATASDDPFTGEWSEAETEKVWEWAVGHGWSTDFRFRKVHFTQIENYNVRDRILPIDNPEFAPASDAPEYMNPTEPVVSLVIDGHARAYPLAILMWHEIVNDTVGDMPVAVTFCPLCNTAIVFDSRVDGQRLRFGTTGNLRNSDLIMWDDVTESWWQQITGEAIIGEFVQTDAVLNMIPAEIVPWERFANDHPDGEVLVRLFDDEGEPLRSYETPPYGGYANSDRNPLAYSGKVDRQLLVTSRVLTFTSDDSAIVYPFEFLAENPVINDVVGGESIVAVFDGTTTSSFEDDDGERSSAGSAAAFSRVVGDRTLSFEADSNGMVDTETGTKWSLSGRGLSGELAGEQLVQVVHGNHFWFAVALFWPDTEIRDSLDNLTGGAG
ncbi:MAG: DUF3179 domain-containing protein [Dehalococcoidia bacterium]